MSKALARLLAVAVGAYILWACGAGEAFQSVTSAIEARNDRLENVAAQAASFDATGFLR
jgi:hypothetical protein